MMTSNKSLFGTSSYILADSVALHPSIMSGAGKLRLVNNSSNVNRIGTSTYAYIRVNDVISCSFLIPAVTIVGGAVDDPMFTLTYKLPKNLEIRAPKCGHFTWVVNRACSSDVVALSACNIGITDEDHPCLTIQVRPSQVVASVDIRIAGTFAASVTEEEV